jgi:hypothetical protein
MQADLIGEVYYNNCSLICHSCSVIVFMSQGRKQL